MTTPSATADGTVSTRMVAVAWGLLMNKRDAIRNRINLLKAITAITGFNKAGQDAAITDLDKLAHAILTNAKRRAPVRTGALRSSGRVQKKGTSTRIIGFGGSGTGVNYAALVEYGGSAASPRPFLRPAFYATVPFYKPTLLKDLRVKWAVASRLGSS